VAVTSDWLQAQGRAHSTKFKYLLACGCGFATDLILLQLGTALGFQPAWVRIVSLFFAMQVTFCINGVFVFRSLNRGRIPHQWFSYMVTNAFGNLCNYLIFTTLLSLHSRILSNHIVAVCAGGAAACGLNYAACRLLVFRREHHHPHNP
jgi:putative flippase GtrA